MRRAPRRTNTWSSNAFFMPRAPESMTRFFRPPSVSFVVKSATSSKPSPLTPKGHPAPLAMSAIWSTLSLVAAYRRGFRSAHTFRPACMTPVSSVMRIMPASVSFFTLVAKVSNLPASPETDFTAMRSALKVRPTLSYSRVLNRSRRPPTSSSVISSVTSTAMPVGFRKVFSWRNKTVSPPILSFLSPVPISTMLIGGADASASSAFASSET